MVDLFTALVGIGAVILSIPLLGYLYGVTLDIRDSVFGTGKESDSE